MAPVTGSLILLILFCAGALADDDVKPAILPPPVKPGTCPKVTIPKSCGIRPPRTLCFADHQCPGRQKCCKDSCGDVKCTNPIVPPVKPGTCPKVTITKSCGIVPPRTLCFADHQCPGRQKCCKDFCGDVKCTDPIGEKPGTCPKVILEGSCPIVPPPPKCHGDEICPDDQKCCEDPCGRVECTNPIK